MAGEGTFYLCPFGRQGCLDCEGVCTFCLGRCVLEIGAQFDPITTEAVLVVRVGVAWWGGLLCVPYVRPVDGCSDYVVEGGGGFGCPQPRAGVESGLGYVVVDRVGDPDVVY